MTRRISLAVFSAALLLAFAAIGAPTLASAEDPSAIVAKADAIRVPEGSYEFESIITGFEGDQKKAENGYKVYVKDLDNTLVVFTQPPTERGKSLLMLGEDLWIYLPNVKKPVRIPLQQRLVGEVSNGDIARLNFAKDYNATLAGEANVLGVDAYVLDLVAKSENKTYNKIKYWVSKADFRPVQSEFFTVSGQSLKTCTYEDFRQSAGAVRPLRLIFRDSLNKDKKSVLVFNNMAKKTLSDNMFTKDYMKTLE